MDILLCDKNGMSGKGTKRGQKTQKAPAKKGREPFLTSASRKPIIE
jgi:hypothetical protein